MKTVKFIKTMIVSCSLIAMTQTAVAEDTLRLTNGEWQPYMSEHVPNYGMGSHIVTEAFALVGIAVEYGFFPWKRAYDVTKKGTWDGTVGWSFSDERGEAFFFSDPVFPSTYVLFHLKDFSFEWNSIEDLQDKKIGVTMEYFYGDDFHTAEKAGVIHPEYAKSDELNLKKLLKGRIQVFIGDVMVTYEQIRDTFSAQEAAAFTHHPKFLINRDLHLLLTKANPDNERMVALFNQGLKQLKENGRYDEIIADALAGKYSKSD